MEGSGEVEYLNPNFEKKPQSKEEYKAKTTRAKEGGVRKKVPPLAARVLFFSQSLVGKGRDSGWKQKAGGIGDNRGHPAAISEWWRQKKTLRMTKKPGTSGSGYNRRKLFRRKQSCSGCSKVVTLCDRVSRFWSLVVTLCSKVLRFCSPVVTLCFKVSRLRQSRVPARRKISPF